MPMQTKTVRHIAALLLGALLLAFSNPVLADTQVAFARTGGATSIPIGHAEFCRTHPAECRGYPRHIELETLDEGRWAQLVGINDQMNRQIVPVSDLDLYNVDELWTYPDGYGDCEDIALAKRAALIASGWDPSTLLMAVVRQPNGEGHAVLMARTDRGDLILDNQDGLIRLWSDTPYQYLKRQSQANPAQWVDIIDERVVAVAQR
jgi:predicted transglutaminase-like cysteine proteinase